MGSCDLLSTSEVEEAVREKIWVSSLTIVCKIWCDSEFLTFVFSSSPDYRNPCFSYVYSRLSLLTVNVAVASKLSV